MGQHLHRCDSCFCIWQHDDSCADACETVKVLAHTCPGCGEENYWRYHGEGEPDFINHHEEDNNGQVQQLQCGDHLGNDAKRSPDAGRRPAKPRRKRRSSS